MAFAGNHRFLFSQQWCRGFRAAVESANLSLNVCDVGEWKLPRPTHVAELDHWGRDWLKNLPRPCAFLLMNDEYTFNMVAAGFYYRSDGNTLDVDRISLTHTAGSAPTLSHPTSGRAAPPVLCFREERERVTYDTLAIEIQAVRLGDAAGELREGLRTWDGSARGNTDFLPVDTELVLACEDRNTQTILITPHDKVPSWEKHFLLELHSPGPGVHLGTRKQMRVEFY